MKDAALHEIVEQIIQQRDKSNLQEQDIIKIMNLQNERLT